MIKDLRRSVAEGGKIKIGGLGEERRAKSGVIYRLPQKHDSFTITKAQREGGQPDGDLIVDTKIMKALVEQGYADDDGKIRRLPIMLHSDVIDEVFPTAYVAYNGRTCACRGDGETATRYEIIDGRRTGESKQIDCPCELLEPNDAGVRRCKFNGVLHCSLRLAGHAVIGSVLRWRTTSQISCQQMVTHLETILYAVGVLRGLPLALVVRPVQVNPPGGKPSTVYVCHVDLCEQIAVAQRAALEAAHMRRDLAGGQLEALEQRYRATLQLPGAEDEQEQAEVAAEYYPDAVVGPGVQTRGLRDLQSGDLAGVPDIPAIPPGGSMLDAPLAGIVPPEQPLPGAPPPGAVAPSQPQPGEKPARRTRRSRCTICGELAHGVKRGMCPACATPQAPPPPAEPPPPAAPPVAPEIGSGPPVAPARPANAATSAPERTGYERVQLAIRAAVGRGIGQDVVFAEVRKVWPDCETRRPEDWSQADGEKIEGILGGLQ